MSHEKHILEIAQLEIDFQHFQGKGGIKKYYISNYTKSHVTSGSMMLFLLEAQYYPWHANIMVNIRYFDILTR